MHIPKITRDKVAKLSELTVAVEKAEEFASELLRTAQDRFNHVEEDVEREGKIVKVKREDLWKEVFYLHGTGQDSQAVEILSKYHKDVFDAYEVQNKAADELWKFVRAEIGMDFNKMRIRDYLNLTEGVFGMLWEEREAALVEKIKAELRGA